MVYGPPAGHEVRRCVDVRTGPAVQRERLLVTRAARLRRLRGLEELTRQRQARRPRSTVLRNWKAAIKAAAAQRILRSGPIQCAGDMVEHLLVEHFLSRIRAAFILDSMRSY